MQLMEQYGKKPQHAYQVVPNPYTSIPQPVQPRVGNPATPTSYQPSCNEGNIGFENLAVGSENKIYPSLPPQGYNAGAQPNKYWQQHCQGNPAQQTRHLQRNDPHTHQTYSNLTSAGEAVGRAVGGALEAVVGRKNKKVLSNLATAFKNKSTSTYKKVLK